MASFHASDNVPDFIRGCVLDLNLPGPLGTDKRTLSQMQSMFHDQAAVAAALAVGDPQIYEFHSIPAPLTDGDLAFGCSFVNPGKVGDEYYFTRGHFHTVLETSEVYYCLRGHGYIMMENPEGDWSAQEMTPGKVVYVPKRYSHRSINVSPDEQLVTFFAFRADAGHDYGTIATKGYRKLLVARGGEPAIVDNPNWK